MAEKRINPFTNEEEDVEPPLLAPSPTDQRILAAPPHTEPLADLIEKVVTNTSNDAGVDVETHVGPSLQGDPLPGVTPLAYIPNNDAPVVSLNPDVQTQHEDVPPANDPAIKAGEFTLATRDGSGDQADDTKVVDNVPNNTEEDEKDPGIRVDTDSTVTQDDEPKPPKKSRKKATHGDS